MFKKLIKKLAKLVLEEMEEVNLKIEITNSKIENTELVIKTPTSIQYCNIKDCKNLKIQNGKINKSS